VPIGSTQEAVSTTPGIIAVTSQWQSRGEERDIDMDIGRVWNTIETVPSAKSTYLYCEYLDSYPGTT
jgi:hypothetical protein